MITHRLDTICDADLIVVLHDGMVAERGTHESLIAQSGVYANLYRAKAATAVEGPDTTPALVLTASGNSLSSRPESRSLLLRGDV